MRENEIKFGDIESGSFFLSFDTETHSILPEQRQSVAEIPGLDGVHDFGIHSYGVRVIQRAVYFDGDYAFLRKHRDEIAAWLSNSGAYKRLVLGDSPEKYYNAKVIAALEFENTKDRQIGTVQFVCNPPWAYSSDGHALTPDVYELINASIDKTQFVFEITSPTATMRLYNSGGSVKPKVKLIGSKIQGSFKINDDVHDAVYISYSPLFVHDGIEVDCEAETVKRMSDGQNVFDKVTTSFFELPHGIIEINFSMIDVSADKKLTAIVDFVPIMEG